jgi:hypothetical protein
VLTLTRVTTITVAPANEASWDDLRAVFGSRGDPARCQCQYFKTRDWRSVPVAERAERLRKQTSCGAVSPMPRILRWPGA